MGERSMTLRLPSSEITATISCRPRFLPSVNRGVALRQCPIWDDSVPDEQSLQLRGEMTKRSELTKAE